MNKTAIVVFSDPKTGSEEALGRVFNGLAAAFDFKEAGEEVKIIFQGAGTRWPETLQKEDHMLHTLYKGVEGKIEGVSCGCVDAFGANASGFDLVTDNQVPGTSGLSSFVKLKKEGYNVLIF
jgi:DsrE/DsrF-like family